MSRFLVHDFGKSKVMSAFLVHDFGKRLFLLGSAIGRDSLELQKWAERKSMVDVLVKPP